MLPEISDSRIQEAQLKMKNMGLNIVNLDKFYDNEHLYKNNLYKKSFTKNWTESMIEDYLKKTLVKGLLLLDNNDVDCVIAGATLPTSDIIRSSIRIIGMDKESKWVTSIFFMTHSENNIAYTYSDCGVIPDPNPEQLASIAFNAAKFHQILTEEIPKIAFLSFSTKGSADHYKVKRVKDAVKLFSKKYPDIIHEGEMQFDAAINEKVSNKKITESALNGDANIFIFPDLDSGNIAYKITQYLAKFNASGPLLCGLSKVVHDLSRGCSIQDIINISTIAAIQKT